MEGHHERSDADDVSVGELHRRGDARVAAKRPVLAVEILERRTFSGDDDPGVTPGDCRRVESHLHIGIPSDDVFALCQRKASPVPLEPARGSIR